MAATSNEELENSALKYFAKTNYLNKQIVSQGSLFIKHMGDKWNDIPHQHKDALLDLLFVNDDVRGIYYGVDGCTKSSHLSNGLDEISESFPRLYVNSGQKINVDFENDLWTWRDEHSGPFSWMSRSQQDLTLVDIEPDNIMKPQTKTLKLDTEESGLMTSAGPHLNRPSSSWCHDIIGDFKQHERVIVLTPSTSMNLATIAAESDREEVNPAFQDSSDELPETSNPAHILGQHSHEQENVLFSDTKIKENDRSQRSPSPKKILRSGSFKKSPSKVPDQGAQKLIKEDAVNVFSNPVVESEWSTFVGEDNTDSSPSLQEPPKPRAPQSMMIDRGEYMGSNSPYCGDKVCLLDEHSSLSEASSNPMVHHMSPTRSDWSSEESTPDHTTHLLKGMQSPVQSKYAYIEPVKIQPSTLPNLSQASETYHLGNGAKEVQPQIEFAEADEVLRVQMEGDKIIVTTEKENQRDSDIPVTGFDFLDNW